MGIPKRIVDFWQNRSLRFWLATGMAMTLCPIFFAAIAGHFLYHQAIIRPLVDVSLQQRKILQPLQNLRMALDDSSDAVIDYSVDGEIRHADEYRQLAGRIDGDLTNLITAVKDHDFEARDVKKAKDDWQELANVSRSILSEKSKYEVTSVGQKVKVYESKVDLLDHQLEKVYDDIDSYNEQSHKQALADVALSEHLATVAFVVSSAFAILGIVLINRSLVASMDKLALGALRLAAGDREHCIEVHVPRELVSVADAFNVMTNQILKQEEALSRAAKTDSLTGLYNRREFDRRLSEEFQRWKRYGTTFSLLICDIDHFKTFNDTYGHQAGDDVLCAVAHTLREGLREVDMACRFGGEEFVLILSECDGEAAIRTAERLRAAIEGQEILLEGRNVAKVTMSFGVALYPGGGTTPESLLRSADTALYQSKKQGRNRVTIANDAVAV